MSDWASRRKSIYLGVLVLILTSVSFLIFWNYWYEVPTCSDNFKNGDETGVDCGGSCALICRADAIKPVVRWDPRLFEVLPGTWSALVYVENLNTDAEASYAPYSFTIYGEGNQVLAERKGVTILPKNKTVGIFEGSINIPSEARPQRAIFELGNDIVWKKSEKDEVSLTIKNTPLLRLDNSPRVEASVKNEGSDDVTNIELVVSVFDGLDNAIAASRTFIAKLKKNEETNIFFTWPRPFDLGSRACENPSNVMLMIDRSGSMSSLGTKPPEPLTSAKNAANFFVEQLGDNDKVGVISFATEVRDPIDSFLTSDFGATQSAIQAIAIEEGSTQYTNIYAGLRGSWQELISSRAIDGASKVAVLLTDGKATYPRNPEGGTEADDIKYAEGVALKEASDAKKDGISIYTIGLGDGINESFLKNVASAGENYFYAPTPDKLQTIYKNISSRICKEVPARIEITYKIFGQSF